MATVYLLGHPVAHSLSPAMQNAAFAALGLPHRYELRDVTAAGLAAALDLIRSGEALGANVTVPHKETVVPLVDTWDGPTAEVRAANTVSRTADGRLLGSNTDVVGFEFATRELALEGRRVLLLGAGGAARAALAVLFRRGASVAMTSRTPERVRRLLQGLAHPAGLPPQAVPWDARTDLREVDVVVNATPAGLSGDDPLDGAALRPEIVVVDLVPSGVPTPLARRARAAGCRVVDGLPMLLQQAASSFTIWTGRPAPVEAMRAALYASVS